MTPCIVTVKHLEGAVGPSGTLIQVQGAYWQAESHIAHPSRTAYGMPVAVVSASWQGPGKPPVWKGWWTVGGGA